MVHTPSCRPSLAVASLDCLRCSIASLDIVSLLNEDIFWRPGGLLPPFSCAYIKGWKRGVILLIALQGIRELKLADQIEHWIKAWDSEFYRMIEMHV